MKRIIRQAFTTSKDIIAVIVVVTWCISIFLPETLVDEITIRSFERIMLIIIGFYFGAHREKPEPRNIAERIIDDYVSED